MGARGAIGGTGAGIAGAPDRTVGRGVQRVGIDESDVGVGRVDSAVVVRQKRGFKLARHV